MSQIRERTTREYFELNENEKKLSKLDYVAKEKLERKVYQ